MLIFKGNNLVAGVLTGRNFEKTLFAGDSNNDKNKKK